MRERFITTDDGGTAYVTVDGDMVDFVAYAYFGTHLGNTEAVYEANPGLADRGITLPAGVVIKLPAKAAQEPTAQFRTLFD